MEKDKIRIRKDTDTEEERKCLFNFCLSKHRKSFLTEYFPFDNDQKSMERCKNNYTSWTVIQGRYSTAQVNLGILVDGRIVVDSDLH